MKRTIERDRLEMLILGLAMFVLALAAYDSVERKVGAIATITENMELGASIFIVYSAFSGLTLLWNFARNRSISTIPYLTLLLPLPLTIFAVIIYAGSSSGAFTAIVVMLLALALTTVAIVYRIPTDLFTRGMQPPEDQEK